MHSGTTEKYFTSFNLGLLFKSLNARTVEGYFELKYSCLLGANLVSTNYHTAFALWMLSKGISHALLIMSIKVFFHKSLQS